MLLWGLPVVGVPVLIHLINMMRHRRVEWAAMEFLLASQKKNRTWVFLKQLLLLLVRMAAIAIVVLLVAKPKMSGQLGAFLGQGRTHHIVLLDDSFSMSDRWGNTSAMDEARSVIRRIGAQAAAAGRPQTFSLLRFSRAAGLGVGAQPDFFEEPVDRDFVDRLRESLAGIEVSETAAGPQSALEAVLQLIGDSDGDQRIVYLVSDFRAKEWDDPAELKNRLAELTDLGAKLHLVRCVDTARPNLAIRELAPGPGIRAAGVPLDIEVTVTNFGDVPVRDVPVLLETADNPRPAVKIEEIPPGRSVSQRFQVRFPTAGEHRVVAHLETDAVAADNFRYAVVEFATDVPVLLVDGDPGAVSARYLESALKPGGTVTTGIRPRIEGPRYLSLNPLDAYQTIYLLDVDRLDPSAIEALEEYVAAGGGLGVFLGERSDSKFMTDELYREGSGLFPLPLSGPAELLVDRLRKAPDLEVGDHPIFRILSGVRNSFINMVVVERYFAAAEGWQPKADSATQIIAWLRNGAPLAVERRFGEGRVVAFLTTVAPLWNNWARSNPSFVVAMLEMQAYLASRPAEDTWRVVGSPLELELDPARYEAAVRFLPPDGTVVATSQAVATPDGSLAASFIETGTSGFYRATLIPKDGSDEVRSYAFNVDAEEGNLAVVDGQTLASRLEGVKYDFVEAAIFQYGEDELKGKDLSQALLYVLLLVLIGEQLLAWSASYHPPARHALTGTGGAP
jgi:hypothetical protein